MKDEGFLSPAGKRFIVIAALLITCGVVAYALLAEDIDLDIDFDDLTDTGTTTTEFEFAQPDFTTPDPLANDPYFRCIEKAETVDEIVACANE